MAKNPRKKLDFFNGGRGVDLSQFDPASNNLSEEYLDIESSQIDFEPNEERNFSNGTLSGPVSPHGSEEQSASLNDSPSPTNAAQHIPYVHAPVPQYVHPGYGQPVLPDPPSNLTNEFHRLSLNPFLHPPPHPHPHQIPPTLPTDNHLAIAPSLYPEPDYGNFIGSPVYSPLRPMNTNGIRLGGMGYFDPIHRMDHSMGINIGHEGDSSKKKRQQKCSLCSNHGFSVDVKGHKWFCDYRDCNCSRCQITKGRQHHMKEQQKLTRQLQRLQ